MWFALHGDIGAAVRANVLLLVAGVWLAGWWLHALAPARTPWLTRWATPIAQRPTPLRRALAALVLAYAVARNLPGTDAWLAPPSHAA